MISNTSPEHGARSTDGVSEVTVVSGNGAAKTFAVPEPKLTDVELEQVKKDTEAFNKWVDTPDSEQALATLPQLSTEELIGNTFDKPQYNETTAEASWHLTVDDEAKETSFSLYFPIEAETKDLSA